MDASDPRRIRADGSGAGNRCSAGPRRLRRALPTLLCAGIIACSPSVTPLVGCEARGDAQPLCGFQNPEDLALLPSGEALLVSEYGGMEQAEPGFLSRLDLADGTRTQLFASSDAGSATSLAGWGDAACPGPPAVFSPHGIDLVERDDGRFALLVVNHGGRESVEMFEVQEPRGAARVAWRGCVVAPPEAWLNDVVGRADGSFFVSHMMPRRGGVAQVWELAKAALAGVASGHVLQWSEAEGFEPVPGTEAALANGIELSPDGSVLFVNANLGGRVRAVEWSSGRALGEAPVAHPDNSTWASDGRLWVASLTGPTSELLACDALEEGSCPSAFEIVAIDPETFATEVIYAGDGVTMGAGTVGLQVGDDLYVGTFAGDRILRVREVH